MNDFKNLNIAVAGTGYVGLSIATLLSQHHHVTAVDVIPEKVEKINNRISPIQDEYIEKYLTEKELDLTATLDGASAYKNADFVVIAAPTNYEELFRHQSRRRSNRLGIGSKSECSYGDQEYHSRGLLPKPVRKIC